MKNKEEQKQHLINMMQGDEELGLYESWVKDAEKESNLSDLNDRANDFWSGYRAGIKAKERMYSEEDLEVAYFEGREGLYSFNDWLEQFEKK